MLKVLVETLKGYKERNMLIYEELTKVQHFSTQYLRVWFENMVFSKKKK